MICNPIPYFIHNNFYSSTANPKCPYYEEIDKNFYTYSSISGLCDGVYSKRVGICLGTREKEEVCCNGDDTSLNCVYFKEHQQRKVNNYYKIYKVKVRKK